jgi:hypothetical protein
MARLSRAEVRSVVPAVIAAQPVTDMHTHLYPPSFGTPVPHRGTAVDPTGLMLWGVDELVTYHYLIAEVYRVVPATKLPYEQFWAMSKAEQADHIWKHLFVERTPISEACRGVVTTLSKLGLDPGVKHLDSLRPWFREQDPSEYIDRVMELANVSSITMTNAVFDDNERQRWLAGIPRDPRFTGVLRFDPLLTDTEGAIEKLNRWGYATRPTPPDENAGLDDDTTREVRRFLHDWCDRVNAIYCAVSLPPEFRVDGPFAQQSMLRDCILPVCEERGIPFAMMIGSRRNVNPPLKDAADMGGVADVQAVCALCRDFPRNRFFVTMLARENQHELAVAARKFGNLMVFGCWWFLNNPSIIDQMTRLRIELLGTTVIPQHSDARVLDQLVYKWDHSRKLIANVLADKYEDLIDAGWPLTRAEVERDARQFLSENFTTFLKT